MFCFYLQSMETQRPPKASSRRIEAATLIFQLRGHSGRCKTGSYPTAGITCSRITLIRYYAAAIVFLLLSANSSRIYTCTGYSPTVANRRFAKRKFSGLQNPLAPRLEFSPAPSSQSFENRKLAVLRMVLTTPEAIIEQASTKKLLDVLIDESVRTAARQPIMMQFDPSSGWVSQQHPPFFHAIARCAIIRLTTC